MSLKIWFLAYFLRSALIYNIVIGPHSNCKWHLWKLTKNRSYLFQTEIGISHRSCKFIPFAHYQSLRNYYKMYTLMIRSNRNLFRVFPHNFIRSTEIFEQGRYILRGATEHLAQDLVLTWFWIFQYLTALLG